MKRQMNCGYTLIELMIVISVIAIIVAFAYPSYQGYVMKSRRADAKAGLTKAALAEEKWRVNNTSYTANIADVGGSSSPDGYYTLSVVSADAANYQLQASPTGVQTGDKCGSFRIDQDGNKTLSGNDSGYDVANCW